MSLLAIQTQGAVVAVKDRAIAVQLGGRTLQQVRAEDLGQVQIYGAVELTSEARRLLARRSVDVLFFSRGGVFESRLLTNESGQGERRLAQYRTLTDDTAAVALARAFVAAKIRNQRAVLRRAQRHRQEERIARALASMRQVLRQVENDQNADVDALRGHEGFAARTYFEGLGAAITHPTIAFTGRNRRPPRDPVNACLSFGYTLLLRRVESAVRAAGLDPYIGALHSAGRGKPALALDLMEEFRPVLVDRIVLRLLNRSQLAEDDFEEPHVVREDVGAPPDEQEESPDPRPAVYLAASGRTLLLREFHGDLRRYMAVDGLDARMTFDAILARQAMQIAHIVEGRQDTYDAFVLR